MRTNRQTPLKAASKAAFVALSRADLGWSSDTGKVGAWRIHGVRCHALTARLWASITLDDATERPPSRGSTLAFPWHGAWLGAWPSTVEGRARAIAEGALAPSLPARLHARDRIRTELAEIARNWLTNFRWHFRNPDREINSAIWGSGMAAAKSARRAKRQAERRLSAEYAPKSHNDLTRPSFVTDAAEFAALAAANAADRANELAAREAKRASLKVDFGRPLPAPNAATLPRESAAEIAKRRLTYTAELARIIRDFRSCNWRLYSGAFYSKPHRSSSDEASFALVLRAKLARFVGIRSTNSGQSLV